MPAIIVFVFSFDILALEGEKFIFVVPSWQIYQYKRAKRNNLASKHQESE
jgi:hypothetical protein